MSWIVTLMLMMSPLPVVAGSLDFSGSDVIVLGEFHDNPDHHLSQAAWIEAIAPAAVVFEMLRPEEAEAMNAVAGDRAALSSLAEAAAWPGFSEYIDVVVASPQIVGAALPREQVWAAFSQGAAAIFGDDADRFGLDLALPEAERETRVQLQFEAHCAAMPLEMMGGMVEAQRLRDAAFAQSVLDALERYGAPVVLITGNGHARTDWGVPAYLARAQPDLRVFSVGQGEHGRDLDAPFDAVLFSDPPEREDPCAVFN